MNAHITLITHTADPSQIEGPAGLLCEIADDSAAFQHLKNVLPSGALLGPTSQIKTKAYLLARKILDGEPALRGLQQLNVFEEVVTGELVRALQAIMLEANLVERGFKSCRIAGQSPLSEQLEGVARANGQRLSIAAGAAPGGRYVPRIKRQWQRLQESGFSRRAQQETLRHLLALADPYHLHRARMRRTPAVRKGEIWFYSTAATFTQAGLDFEPYFPSPFQFLIENPATGGAPLARTQRPFHSVYTYGRSDFVASTGELRAAKAAIRNHIDGIAANLDEVERLAISLFLESGFFRLFETSHLPQGLYATRMFEHWAESVEPSALVVGNPVFEAYALNAARAIPTIVVQHGALGNYRQLTGQPGGVQFVRGEFWRQFLAAGPRARALVLNPGVRAAQLLQAPEPRRAVLFLTAPVNMLPNWHQQNSDDIISTLFAACRQTKQPLTVRVHPLEDVESYRRKFQSLSKKTGHMLDVRFTSMTPISTDIAQASVAVLYFSTAFQDCLAAGVPIVSFGWHDFAFKEQIEPHRVFHFARNLEDLARLIVQGAAGRLAPSSCSPSLFLDPTPEAKLRETIANTLTPTRRAQAPAA